MDAKRFFDELFARSRAATDTVDSGPASPAHGPVQDHEPTPDDLPGYWREVYEERAAIREFDGGQCREHAEAEALREILAMMRDGGSIYDP